MASGVPGFVGGVAELFEGALGALGFAGVADGAAVVDQLVGELNPAVVRDDLHQVLFDGLRGFAAGEAQAAGDAKDVRIDDDAFSFAVGDAENNAGGLASGSGDGEQLGHGLRDFAVELLAHDAACALDRFGFVVVEAGGANELFNRLDRCFGHALRRGVSREELGGDHVDAGVGALGAEDGRDQKLPGRGVDQRALGGGVGFAEDFENGLDAVGVLVAFGGLAFG